jgi:hypothetical protein
MSDTKHIYLQGDAREITIREGHALPLKEPEAYRFTGDLKCVRAYLDKHTVAPPKTVDVPAGEAANVLAFFGDSNWVDPTKAVIEVDRTNMTIVLKSDPQSAYGTEITGKLVLSDELKKFHINANKTFKRKEFLDLLRFSRIYFSSQDVHEKMVTAFAQVSVKSSTDVQSGNDQRGNKNASMNKNVNSDGLPVDFILCVPIFKGYEKRSVTVQVCLDTSENEVIFWLESVELAELLVTERDALIEKELDGLDKTYVVMNQ